MTRIICGRNKHLQAQYLRRVSKYECKRRPLTTVQSSLLWVVSTSTALLAWLHDEGLYPPWVANYPVLGCGILHHTRITVNLDPICKLVGSEGDRATVLVTPDRELTIASLAMSGDSISWGFYICLQFHLEITWTQQDYYTSNYTVFFLRTLPTYTYILSPYILLHFPLFSSSCSKPLLTQYSRSAFQVTPFEATKQANNNHRFCTELKNGLWNYSGKTWREESL